MKARLLLFVFVILAVNLNRKCKAVESNVSMSELIQKIIHKDNLTDHQSIMTYLSNFTEEELARIWLKNLSDVYLSAMPIMSKISWLIDIKTPDDSDEWKVFDDIGKLQFMTSKFSQQKMKELNSFNWQNFTDPTLKRSFHRALTLMGDSGIEDVAKIRMLKAIKSTMVNRFSIAKINYNNTQISLDPDINMIFEKSRDYDHLSNMWAEWRAASGKSYANLYPTYVQLSNEATSGYGFNDYGEYSRSSFEVEDLDANFDEVYSELEELYKLLHAYTKKKLIEIYPEQIDSEKGAMPAHILGDLWAQQWHNIYEDIKPYKDKPLLDITPNMQAKNMTIHEMVRIAEEFFQSLGMDPLPELFWSHSIFVKPTDGREINCHASAWDFLNGKDFRIKMCSEVTMNDLFVMHHEMGHIYYYMHYKDQPFQFKEGANPGFHEAIGDLMTLSVMTPTHLNQINLLDEIVEDEEQDINFLLFSALRNIAFAPFGLAVEKWRWAVYAGKSTPDTYNIDWWKLRCKYQGLVPPISRSKADFDPGSKYHIAANVPYDRYFVSLILTFQFHEALCKESGHTGPLHKCDIYQSKKAGKKLSRMMEKGISEPWPDVLKDLTDGRQDSLDPSSILEYFKPLTNWLRAQNLTQTDWDCDSYIDQDNLLVKSYDGKWESSMAAARLHISIISSFTFTLGFFAFYNYLTV